MRIFFLDLLKTVSPNGVPFLNINLGGFIMYYEWIKDYYDDGYYTNEQVKVFVEAGWITAAEYEQITGEPYVA